MTGLAMGKKVRPTNFRP